jgi:hypothetical protein
MTIELDVKKFEFERKWPGFMMAFTEKVSSALAKANETLQ